MTYSNIDSINTYLKSTYKTLGLITRSDKYLNSVLSASQVLINSLKSGNKIYIAGNGGSAADAPHFAAELVSRFMFDRNPLPAIALTTDSSSLTAIGNDYGFDQIFSRQLNAVANKDDIFIGISTSGKSPNIVKAFDMCKQKKITSIAFSGIYGISSSTPDHLIAIPSESTPIIQEMHLITYHMLCSIIESNLFQRGN